jgi:hypothetical protein
LVVLFVLLLVALLLLLALVEEDVAWDSVEGIAGINIVDEGMEEGAGAERVEDVDKMLVYEDEDEDSENKVEVGSLLAVMIVPGATENDEMLFDRAFDDADAAVVASTPVLLFVGA